MRFAFCFPAVILTIWPVLADPIKPVERLLPPKGVEIAESEMAALRSELAAVEKDLATVARHPLEPDVEVFTKAVAFAIENGEFYKPEHTRVTRDVLRMAAERLKEMQAGRTPWTTQHGPVVRGFRSPLDGSVQPYGVEVPPAFDFTAPAKVYLWLHGRGDAETDLYFVQNRATKKGQFAPPADTIVIHPFGRHCLGFKSAGEMDVIEALDHAKTQYHLDENRIALMGFSMGGAGAWHLGAHYADRWAVVHAGAGFIDVRRYLGTDPTTVPKWESALWGLYDVPDYCRNFFNVPLLAYSGEIDKQKASADIMEEELRKEGYTLKRVIGAQAGHKYTPEGQKEVQGFIDAALVKGRDMHPREIHFQTRTLRYHRFRWLDVTGLDEHWKDARVDAALDGGLAKLTTRNVSSVDLTGDISRLEIDGQKIVGSAGSYVKLDGRWQHPPAVFVRTLQKRPGLQGPMDDALMAPFLVVTPSKPCASPQVGRWVEFEIAHFEKQWRELFRGRLRMKKDSEVTPADINSCNLILWGDPASNGIVAKIAGGLPVRWDGGNIIAGASSFPAASHIPALIYPNPLAPNHYVVLNNGCSFREAHAKTNALQNPKLPDWAVIDLSQDPDATVPGRIAAADFFDEQWRLKAPADK